MLNIIARSLSYFIQCILYLTSLHFTIFTIIGRDLVALPFLSETLSRANDDTTLLDASSQPLLLLSSPSSFYLSLAIMENRTSLKRSAPEGRKGVSDETQSSPRRRRVHFGTLTQDQGIRTVECQTAIRPSTLDPQSPTPVSTQTPAPKPPRAVTWNTSTHGSTRSAAWVPIPTQSVALSTSPDDPPPTRLLSTFDEIRYAPLDSTDHGLSDEILYYMSMFEGNIRQVVQKEIATANTPLVAPGGGKYYLGEKGFRKVADVTKWLAGICSDDEDVGVGCGEEERWDLD
jgi:hypothetical protein